MRSGLLVLLSLLLASAQSYCPADEATRYEAYLKDLKLSPNAPPIERVGKILLINSTFNVVSVIKIDASLQTVRFGAILMSHWHDYRVERNISRGCGIRMPVDFLWSPQLNVLQLTQGTASSSLSEVKLLVFGMVSKY